MRLVYSFGVKNGPNLVQLLESNRSQRGDPRSVALNEPSTKSSLDRFSSVVC
jgi:hypothetical protein